MGERVLLTHNGPIVELVLNRPEKRNALDLATLEELFAALNEACRDKDAHVIVLHGKGEGFCAGADLDMLGKAVREADPVAAFSPAVDVFQQVIHLIAAAPKITLAAAHGFALGAGLDIILACDLRLVAKGTTLACSYVKHGLVPDGGATWALARLIGLGPAIAMLLSGDAIEAEGAYRLGLVHKRVPEGQHVEEALRWAAELAQRSLPAQVAIKRLARIDPRLSLSAALKEEKEAQRRLILDGEPIKFLGTK